MMRQADLPLSRSKRAEPSESQESASREYWASRKAIKLRHSSVSDSNSGLLDGHTDLGFREGELLSSESSASSEVTKSEKKKKKEKKEKKEKKAREDAMEET